MRIRIYYKPDSRWTNTALVTGIVIINDEDWNMAEIIKDGTDSFATFDLTEENIDLYMDGADVVNLETIREVEGKL